MTTSRKFNPCYQLTSQGLSLVRFFQRGLFLLLALVLILASLPLTGAAAQKNKDTIVELESEGQVQVKPDKATFQFTVVTEAAQAEEAAQMNAKEADKFLAAVKKVLGPEDQVKTVQYRVLPVFKRVEKTKGKEKIRTDKIAGYRASHRFEAELRDLKKIGLIADTALKNGANQVQGPYFSHTQQEDLQSQAAVKALERARQLAEALAQASGLKVKRVTKISTTHLIQPRVLMAKAAPPSGTERDVQTPIEVGDITYRAHLTVSFALAP
jgi:uncharacterized protein YggE